MSGPVASDAVRAPRSQAEATRRRLLELGVLRPELEVARDGADILFPVTPACGPRLPVEPWRFKPRPMRVQSYLEYLDWPPERLVLAPRAFEQLGDLVVVKVPPELRDFDEQVGDALLRFHEARAVFHDNGVRGTFRTRDLQLIAGQGGSLTRMGENGVQLWVDLAQAYFSPRLATERARVAAHVRPGEHLVDLFGGVAPLGVQAAKRGAGVDSVDLNPAAIELGRRNVEENRVAPKARGVPAHNVPAHGVPVQVVAAHRVPAHGVLAPAPGEVRLHLGDAREVANDLVPADRVVMNLPHGAKEFLDVAARLLRPDGVLHYHEILAPGDVAARAVALEAELSSKGWKGKVTATRVVRNYSPSEAHIVFDVRGSGQPS